MYFIRHLINTRLGNKVVDVKQMCCTTCVYCKREISGTFYGHDTNSTYSIEAVYKYTVKDIIGEYSNVKKGFLHRKCERKICKEYLA